MRFLCFVFTWLTDEEANIVPKNRRVAVQEVAGQLHHDWQLRQLLEDLSGLKIKDTIFLTIFFFLYLNYHTNRWSSDFP